jgi:hypothetical protein
MQVDEGALGELDKFGYGAEGGLEQRLPFQKRKGCMHEVVAVEMEHVEHLDEVMTAAISPGVATARRMPVRVHVYLMGEAISGLQRQSAAIRGPHVP